MALLGQVIQTVLEATQCYGTGYIHPTVSRAGIGKLIKFHIPILPILFTAVQQQIHRLPHRGQRERSASFLANTLRRQWFHQTRITLATKSAGGSATLHDLRFIF